MHTRRSHSVASLRLFISGKLNILYSEYITSMFVDCDFESVDDIELRLCNGNVENGNLSYVKILFARFMQEIADCALRCEKYRKLEIEILNTAHEKYPDNQHLHYLFINESTN